MVEKEGTYMKNDLKRLAGHLPLKPIYKCKRTGFGSRGPGIRDREPLHPSKWSDE